MNSDIPNPVQDSSSSSPMVVSLRSEPLLDLGKRIVEELGPDQEVATLARWMAHYVAELIQGAEAATGEERLARKSACAAAILDLWKHRSHLPDGRRPFTSLEPVLRALESLDPDSNRVRYYYQPLHEANEGEERPEVRQWLRIAEQLDDSAKILIRYCLARASQSALDKSKPWVALAEAAGLDDGVEFPVIRFVSSEADLLESLELDNSDRKRIEDRIRRLEKFRETSDILMADLRKRLDTKMQIEAKGTDAAAVLERKASVAQEETASIETASPTKNVPTVNEAAKRPTVAVKLATKVEDFTLTKHDALAKRNKKDAREAVGKRPKAVAIEQPKTKANVAKPARKRS